MTPFFHQFVTTWHFITILSLFITIYDETTETIQQRQAQSSERRILNGTKKVIAVTESINACLNMVEVSFQIIIDACDFSVPALHQLIKNVVFL